MNFKPAPRFVFLVAVDRVNSKVGALEVIEDNPTAMGKVVAMNSPKLAEAGMKIGDVAYFNPEHGSNSIVRIKVGQVHVSLFEECVLGWVPEEEIDAKVKFVGNFNKPKVIEEPGVMINGRRHRPTVH